jgi:hypothetical protein
MDSDSTAPVLFSVVAAHRAITPIRPIRDFTVNWAGVHVAVKEPLLVWIASLTTVFHSHIDNPDVVLLPTTTGVRAVTLIEPISEHTVNRTRYSRAINFPFQGLRANDTTMVILDDNCALLYPLALATRCRADSCVLEV